MVLPGVCGLAAWLSQNKNIIPLIIGSVSLRMLARPLPHILQHSLIKNTLFDNIFEKVIKKRDPRSQIVNTSRISNEFQSGGNPLYNGDVPWVNFPMLSLARALPKDDIYFPYKEYLTHLDDLDKADIEAIKVTASTLVEVFNLLEEKI